MESKYFANIERIHENDSHGIILSQIAPSSIVLECGCASGYMTRYMTEVRGAKVSIVELSPSDYEKAREYAADGICADLESREWWDYYQGQKFDYILFADVLEHLRNPESVLNRAVDLLKEDGTVIASIPNVAHADILVNLLNGRWNYTPLGLLDNTHIHFWAEKNLDGLFRQAGLTVVEQDYTILSPFTTEQKSEENIPGLLPAIYTLCHQPFADVYQFVFSAKKTDYVRKTGIVCTDHYTERHSAYWIEPPCCSEYLKAQNQLEAQHEEREKLIRFQERQLDQLTEQSRTQEGMIRDQQARIAQLTEQSQTQEGTIRDQQAHITQLTEQNRTQEGTIRDQQAHITQLTEQSRTQEGTIRDQQAHIGQLEAQNRDLTGAAETQRVRIAQLQEHSRQLQESFDTISNAECWKITKPVRTVLDFVKSFHVNPYIRLFIHSLRVYGIGATAEKAKRHLKHRKYEKELAKYPTEEPAAIAEFRSVEELMQACIDNRYTVYAKENLERCARPDQERVLLISHELDLTGAPIVLSHLAEWLTEKKLNPVVVARHDGPLRKMFTDRGIPVIVNESVFQSDFVRKCAPLFSLVAVNTIVGAPVITQLSGTDIPVLWWIHEARVSYHPGSLGSMPEQVKENVHIYCISDHAEKILHEYRPGYCAWQLLYFIPDYANMPVSAACPIPIDGTKTVFVCVGALEERKGQDILVAAIRRLTNEERSRSLFVFVGRKYYLPIFHVIESTLRDYPDSIRYIPQLAHEEVIALYQKMDCLICPSKDDPMPTTVAEAMSLSRLIICSENTGTAELLKKTGGGIIYRNDDPAELADCLARVIKGRDDFNEMRTSARRAYEDNFTKEMFDTHIGRIYSGLTTKAPLSVDVTVSVIIPTFNGGKDLPALLELLSKQADVREIEIIVVDSGSTDDTLAIAAYFGAKIIQITQDEFSHSFARNLGAKHASGEYLLFMTQDAKPGSEHWVRDMAQPILRDIAVAVSCKEEPRDDCDLLGRFSLWIHSRYMGILEQDRVLSMPASNEYDAMRRNSQLDDVACMIRRDVFSQFEYRGSFAEDLDLGLRLIRKGYRLSLLGSSPVIHSHNRPAFYYLKRCLMDITTLKELFSDLPVEKLTEDTATNRIIGMTAAIWHYVKELTETQNIPTERRSFFAWSTRFFDAEKQKLRVLSYEDFAPIIIQKPSFCDGRFYDFVQALYFQASKSFRVNTDWLDMRRNSILKDLEDYLAYTGESFTKETTENIAELFVKHCGQATGETLAYYTQTHGQEASFLNDWVLELRRGV